ncbi:hypothetical protein Strvi_2987 [Streptomyces violaceusniger Tu 4113]|uniref:Uncharacterized protein n=1 Tax=Streptomyces violaceusniger (strain Tu 4113) TaxID=653045 RepID=G2PDT4_STRV4|nr:hypothetical protein Strvi_2987 [Streptomyces violaceusniger Tu 4113]
MARHINDNYREQVRRLHAQGPETRSPEASWQPLNRVRNRSERIQRIELTCHS